MNRRLTTVPILWMYVSRTCLVDFFATVKRGSYMYGHTLSHLLRAGLNPKNNRRELVSFDQVEALIISE